MNGYLLDTHTLIWWVNNSDKLSDRAKQIIVDTDNPCFFSLASSWEMSIKSSIGKLRLSIPVRDYVIEHLAANQFKQLNITLNHVTQVEKLAWHHRDPFDRLLIAQAMEEELIVLSADSSFDFYPVERLW